MMTKHLTNSTKAKTSFTILSMCIAMLLSGCDVVKQLVGSGANAPTNPGAQAPQQQPATHGPMDGYWKLAFQFNEDVKSSHIRVSQIGDKFSGQGTDDETGKPFLVENGVVRQDEVVFYKRYEQPDNPNQPPVEYGGKVDF